MNYLFLGDDYTVKNNAIDEIKKKYLLSGDSQNFDYELLYASKLNPDDLKKSLLSLPVISPQRIVVIREAQKLNERLKKIILEFIQAREKRIILVLDSEETQTNNSFLEQIRKYFDVRIFSKQARKNVFDVTRAMERNNSAEALKVLSELFTEGIHPLQLMGGLVWFWAKVRDALSADQFKKGLLVLGETDINIKRSRLIPEYAIEVAVAKLTAVMHSQN